MKAWPIVLCALSALAVAFAAGCGSDAPDADELPLAPGLEVVAHEEREPFVYEAPKPNELLITGKARNGVALRNQEIAYLRQLGWNIQRHFETGGGRVISPDEKLYSAIVPGHQYCGFEEWQGQLDGPHMCATLVDNTED